MPIDAPRVVGAVIGDSEYSWTEKDLVFYNLAVGAGSPPDDPAELKYVYEANTAVVPAFGTIPPFALAMSFGSVEGLDVTLDQILHGDQRLEIHRPIPSRGTVSQTGRVVDIYDKGRGALVVVEVVSSIDGEPLFTSTSGVYLRGEGGFGGHRGPEPVGAPPEREPDRTVEVPTLPQQALLYRLASGDGNPLHFDPAFAQFAGFERPILHGLCTYGMVCKAVVESALGGEPEGVREYSARFSGHVFPGETLVVDMWYEAGGELRVSASTKERGLAVVTNGLISTG